MSEFKTWLEDHYDADILAPESIQDVLEALESGDPLTALAKLVQYRKEAWSVEQDRRDRDSDAFIDSLVNQYGVDRFGSHQAGVRAWQSRAA